MKYRDIIIVGAGPAGCIAGIACRRLGLSVALLERQSFPRNRPGESLPPAIEPLLRSVNAEHILEKANYRRYSGIQVKWGASNEFKPLGSDHRGPWQGYQAIRSDFDGRLLKQAKLCGVEVFQPCRTKNLITQNMRVTGLDTDQGTFMCNYLIDATGGRHWLARQLSIKITKHSPKFIAQYRYIDLPNIPENAQPELVSQKDGWSWRAPISKTRYAKVSLRYDGKLENKSSPPKSRGADVTWRCIEKPAGPGYFCLGDAACVLDPLSSHGVLRAVMSAKMSASLIARNQTKQAANNQSLYHVYNQWILEWFEHDRKKLKQAYAELKNQPSWAASTI